MSKISDNDPIYEVLDQWHEEDQYEKILAKIEEIPMEERSNKLWFRKISALNNLKRFDEAREEIKALSQYCETAEDNGRLFYMLGYIFDNSDCELKAIECWRRALEIDPSRTDTDELVKSSMSDATDVMQSAAKTMVKLLGDFDAECDAEKAKKEVSEPQAYTLLGLASTSLISFNMGVELDVNKAFYKCEDEATKNKIRAYLAQGPMPIKDLPSLQEYFTKQRIGVITCDIMNLQEQGGTIPVEKLNAYKHTHFDATWLCVKEMKPFLTKSGMTGWDYSDLIGLARLMYAADMLTNEEYSSTCLFAYDECKKLFRSWKEFAHSVVIGAFYNYMMRETTYNIRQAAHFAISVGVICKKVYPKLDWI